MILPFINSFPSVRWRAVGPRDIETDKKTLAGIPRHPITTEQPFVYEEAFDRNVGWITSAELQVLRRCRVAIGGLGGVGGAHALSLARLGVGRFTIADADTFDWPNMNRQVGCFASTIGKSKCETLATMLLDVNPEIQVTTIPTFIDESNLDKFLEGADLYIDSYDLFCTDIRRVTFNRCRELGIPAITAAPVGWGTSLACFLPTSISFDDYFNYKAAKTEHEKVVHFLAGVSPRLYQGSYIADKARVNLAEQKTCSTSVGINLAVGVATAYAIKLLLGRGDVITAPSTLHFDAYRNAMTITWRPWGNKNPIQRLLIFILLSLTSRRS